MGTGPAGSILGENSFYRAQGGKRARATCDGCTQQRYATREPGKVQERDRVWIVEGSCGYQVLGVSIRGKFVLSRNLGYKTRGVAIWLNIVLNDPRVAYPEVKVQVRNLVRVVGIVSPFAFTGDRYPGKIHFI